MFKYSKSVDQWSKRMIIGIDKVWGQAIPKDHSKIKLITPIFLKNYLNSYFSRYGEKIFLKLNTVFSSNYKASDFKYFINTTSVSLHNAQEKFISISINHEFSRYPTIVIHELFHLFFYLFIQRHPTKANEETLNDIKEILTVIINLEFDAYIDVRDEGYPTHQKKRGWVKNYWLRNKNINELITELSQ